LAQKKSFAELLASANAAIDHHKSSVQVSVTRAADGVPLAHVRLTETSKKRAAAVVHEPSASTDASPHQNPSLTTTPAPRVHSKKVRRRIPHACLTSAAAHKQWVEQARAQSTDA
jgi:hypothetical protein